MAVKGCRNRWKLIVGLMLAVCCGGPLLLGLGATHFARLAVKKELDLARKAGISLSPPSHHEAVHPEDNAAELYMRAFDEMGKVPKKDLRPFIESESLALDQLKPILDHHRDVFSLLDKAMLKPRANFSGAGSGFEFASIYSKFNQASRLYAARARYQLKSGNPESAVEDVGRMFRLAAHSSDDPTAMSLLSGIAVEHMAQAQYKRMLSELKHDASALRKAEELITGLSPLPSIRNAVSAEPSDGWQALTEDEEGFSNLLHDETKWTRELERLIADSQFYRLMTQAHYLRSWRRVFELFPADEHDYRAFDKAFLQVSEELEEGTWRLTGVASKIFPVYSNMGANLLNIEVERRLCRLATRLLLESAATGSFPAQLPNVGDLTIDPFSGKPFLYKRHKDGFILYSVGKNGVDESGDWDDLKVRVE
jgi:hypothetical protein